MIKTGFFVLFILIYIFHSPYQIDSYSEKQNDHLELFEGINVINKTLAPDEMLNYSINFKTQQILFNLTINGTVDIGSHYNFFTEASGKKFSFVEANIEFLWVKNVNSSSTILNGEITLFKEFNQLKISSFVGELFIVLILVISLEIYLLFSNFDKIMSILRKK